MSFNRRVRSTSFEPLAVVMLIIVDIFIEQYLLGAGNAGMPLVKRGVINDSKPKNAMKCQTREGHHGEMNQIMKRIFLTIAGLVMAACGGKDTNSPNSLANSSRNTAPEFTSEINITSHENVEVVTVVNALDAEGTELTYGIAGGVDADFFDIDSRTGELRFREAPDFETRRDSNANNRYIVVISATDGANTTRQTVAVLVNDDRLTVEVPDGYIKTLKLNWPAVRGVTRYQLFVNSDVTTSLQPSALDITTTETETNVTLPVHLTDWFNNRYLLVEGYNDHGQVFRSDPLEIRPFLVLDSIGYFKASNTDEYDWFGASVALSADGQTLAVGAPHEDSAATGVDGDQGDNTAYKAGAAYVYTRTGAAWTQQAYIKASNTDEDDSFGSSVALSADGQTLVVGAPHEDSAATGVDGDQGDNTAEEAGAVYVYTRTEAAWTQQAYIKASNTDEYDWFGASVALSADGQTLVVGVWGEDSAASGVDGDQSDNTAENAGAVYVYTRTGAVWTQQAYLKASNTDGGDAASFIAGDTFGVSVALTADGQILVVGAPCEASAATGVNGDQGDNTAPCAGAVYVYTRAGAVWTQQAYLKASNTDAYDGLGSDVALSADGQTLVVGAPGEDSAATGVGGDQGDNTADGAGAVYVYTRAGAVWSQQAYIKASNTDVDGDGLSLVDEFGSSVELSADGETLVVGAPHEDSAATGVDGDQGDNTAEEAGAVYVYTRVGAAWTQQAYLKASNTDAYDRFGSSAALSADGQTLAVGASHEDSAATGVGGDQNDNTAFEAGAVYLY